MLELNSLTDVLVEEIADLHSAEQQLLEAFPKFVQAAHSYALRETLEAHQSETEEHIRRLEESLASMGITEVPEQTCKAMRGLLQEANDVFKASGDPVAIDAALIGAGQRIEHHEIAAYGTARALASELGLSSAAHLLDQTLDEEGRANKALTRLAEGGFLSSGINRLAAERTDDAVEIVSGSPEQA